MTEPLQCPKRKDPLKKTRAPLVPPAARSRAAHLLTLAAAEGRFALPACRSCGTLSYPARDACERCLATSFELRDVGDQGALAAATVIRATTDPYFRERLPWRIGTVILDAGPVVLAHLHGDCLEGGRVRLEWRLDRSGQAVALALPEKDTPHMADDPQLRELSADPRHRRVLITDARTATGQAMVEAFLEAGAALVFAGIAEPWKPLSATKRLAARADVEIVQRGQTHGSDPAWLAAPAGVEIVPLDVTDTESIADLASAIAHRVDILVNTAEHVRPGGLLDRAGLAVAREEMDAGYLGLVRLAQAFGPVLRARGADGVNSAAAWVNLISAYALMTWPPYGGYSAAQAAMLSGAISLRSELRAGGIRVVNVFAGPLDTEWFQTLPPPKVAPGAVARATVAALRRGQEDVFVGDIANDIRARLAANAKALERELGA